MFKQLIAVLWTYFCWVNWFFDRNKLSEQARKVGVRFWVTLENLHHGQLMKPGKKNFNYVPRSFAFFFIFLLNHSKLINSNFIFLCLPLASLARHNRNACLFASDKQCSHFMGVNSAHFKTVVRLGSHWSLTHLQRLCASAYSSRFDLFSF